MRTLVISIVCIGTLLLGVWLVMDKYVLDDHTEEPDQYGEFPDIPLEEGLEPTERVVRTESGEVSMRDVRDLAYAEDIGEGMYNFNGTAQQPNSGFAITYSESNDSFSIAILERPLDQYQEYASKYFLELTQLREVDACKLNVFVSVPFEVNPELAGKNFRLSYCADAVTMRE